MSEEVAVSRSRRWWLCAARFDQTQNGSAIKWIRFHNVLWRWNILVEV